MKQFGNIKVLFIAGFGPIVRDAASNKLYPGEPRHPFQRRDRRLFAYRGAARSQDVRPVAAFSGGAVLFQQGFLAWQHPYPSSWLEFDVDSVEKATAELESQGYRMLVKIKKEPWGQTVSRFLGPEGLLVGITFTPVMRQEK